MSPLAILGALLVAGASPAVPAPRGALLLLDVPAADAPRVKSALGDRVLDEATTKKIEADAAEVGLGCPELSDACAKGFAQLAGVDEVVVVTVRPPGGARLTRPARLDARTGRVVDVTVGLLASRPGDGGVAVAVVAANLFAKEKTPAPVPVDVVVQPAGTPIHIDGRPAALRDGTAWLLPGPHELVLEGPAAATTKIVVTDRGEPGRVELAVVGPPSSPTVTNRVCPNASTLAVA